MKNISFNDTLIDRIEIPQCDLNIDNKTRSNLFNWNGQFSPQFIEAILSKYSKPGFFVLDPFLGSGTVLAECARKGLQSFGVELNASAYFMAKTYEIVNLTPVERETVILTTDELVERLSVDNTIDCLTETISDCKDSIIKNTLSVLMVLLDIYNNTVTKDLVITKWEWLKQLVRSLPYSTATISARLGDARKLDLYDAVIDLLITSPPYINVFNYHQKYRKSVEALGYDVLDIARSEFGSNRKHRGNRLYTVIQYCIDMSLSMLEAMRVCKNGTRMIYVVGRESTVLGYSFCNSELIYNIATKVLGLKFKLRQERVFKNRYGQMIYEDILHFINGQIKTNKDTTIIGARSVAVEMLESKLCEDNKNHAYLTEAINNASKIKQSEVIQ